MLQQFGAERVQSQAAVAAHLVGETRLVVEADHRGHAAQGPENCLDSLLQGREGLPRSHLGVPTPRMTQRDMERQAPERAAAGGRSRGFAVGGVGQVLPARGMLTGRRWTFCCGP